MKMEDNMMTTKNLNSIAMNAIFSKVLKTDPNQEAPGDYEQMPLRRGYKMCDERTILVIDK